MRAKLAQSRHAKAAPFLPDVQIYHNAVRYALQYREFFAPGDINKAKALMKEAGFADGFEMACLALSGNGDDANNLTAVQQMFGQLGVKLRIDQVDNATRTARYREADFQCRTAAWTGPAGLLPPGPGSAPR